MRTAAVREMCLARHYPMRTWVCLRRPVVARRTALWPQPHAAVAPLTFRRRCASMRLWTSATRLADARQSAGRNHCERLQCVLANRVLWPVAQWWSGILRTVRMRPLHRAMSVIVTGDAPRCSRRSTRGNGARGSLDSKGTRPGTRAIGSQSAGARIRRCLHRWFCPWTSRRL